MKAFGNTIVKWTHFFVPAYCHADCIRLFVRQSLLVDEGLGLTVWWPLISNCSVNWACAGKGRGEGGGSVAACRVNCKVWCSCYYHLLSEDVGEGGANKNVVVVHSIVDGAGDWGLVEVYSDPGFNIASIAENLTEYDGCGTAGRCPGAVNKYMRICFKVRQARACAVTWGGQVLGAVIGKVLAVDDGIAVSVGAGAGAGADVDVDVDKLTNADDVSGGDDSRFEYSLNIAVGTNSIREDSTKNSTEDGLVAVSEDDTGAAVVCVSVEKVLADPEDCTDDDASWLVCVCVELLKSVVFEVGKKMCLLLRCLSMTHRPHLLNPNHPPV
ncbi:hypothetical protein BX661DRAFT_204545 [Kickxella alabastrina]|uniref:uncharacterized protein n=1 Tax=Kickxella alabastrina TaxID=61397 RepID=UPI00221ED443|nr:uncharacterized protein BX661DRAFT_204545 [Kickxella alabastrina]KAI7830943.1 hypothetical protein BX661DRAFT_204545 [Kickxella alabastrina]